MKRIFTTLLSILFTVNSFAAQCSKPVTYLKQGDKTPCTGYLFTPQKELEARKAREDNDLLKQENVDLNNLTNGYKQELDNYNKVLDLERQKTKLWQNEATSITTKYVKLQDSQNTRNMEHIALGALAVLLGAWSVKQVSGR